MRSRSALEDLLPASRTLHIDIMTQALANLIALPATKGGSSAGKPVIYPPLPKGAFELKP